MSKPLPKRLRGNDMVDPWRDEMMHSLLDGTARYKAPPDDTPEDRRKEKHVLVIGGRNYVYEPKPITLPKIFEPDFLR